MSKKILICVCITIVSACLLVGTGFLLGRRSIEPVSGAADARLEQLRTELAKANAERDNALNLAFESGQIIGNISDGLDKCKLELQNCVDDSISAAGLIRTIRQQNTVIIECLESIEREIGRYNSGSQTSETEKR